MTIKKVAETGHTVCKLMAATTTVAQTICLKAGTLV